MADKRALRKVATEEEARWGSAAGAQTASLLPAGRPGAGTGQRGLGQRAADALLRDPSGAQTSVEFLAASSLGERRPEGERRRHYRTAIPGSWGLEATLRTWEGDVMPARLLDMSIGGAGIRVRAVEVPLRVGAAVELRVRGPGIRSPLAVAAQIQRFAPEPEGYFYGLRFARVLELGQQLPDTLREVFNRRRSFRVRPHARAPIPLLVAALVNGEPDPTRVIELVVSDISAGGVSFLATEPQARTLGEGLNFELQLHLPDHSAALPFVARMRYRLRVRAGYRYGVAFDTTRTLGFMAQQRLVTAYVLNRQRELLNRLGTP